MKSTDGRPRVIVCGTRTFADRELLTVKLDAVLGELVDPIVVTGAAPGADTLAEEWAYFRRHTVMRFHPDWDADGKAAGPIRNGRMLAFALERKPAYCVAFWDGKSPGTRDMIDRATKAGLRVRVIRYQDIYKESERCRGLNVRAISPTKPGRGRRPARGG